MADQRTGANPDGVLNVVHVAAATVQPYERGFAVYGVRVAVGASESEVLERLVALMPAGAEPCDPRTAQRAFAVTAYPEIGWRYESGDQRSAIVTDLDLAIALLDSELRLFVGSTAPARVFIHAGVVAQDGRAIVLPGASFSGKSTLVAALVDAGAVYCSDEYAVLDAEGLVHPYARPVSVRGPGADESDLPTLRRIDVDATVGADPIPVGVIAATRYIPGATWDPKRQSAGKGVLALLENALPARERPAETMAAARRAAATAIVLEGDRGEAGATARALLELSGERA